MQIGYARVSMSEQNIDGQVEALRDAGCEKVFADHGVGGGSIRRPELDRLAEQLRPGDVVVVQALDRLARNLRFLLEILDTLKNRGVGIKSLREPLIDTTTASGELVLQIFGVIAQFERQRIRERIHAGLAHAKKNGKVLGRPRVIDDEKAAAIARLRWQGTSIAELGRTLGVTPPTIRKYLASQEACAESAEKLRRPRESTVAELSSQIEVEHRIVRPHTERMNDHERRRAR